MTTQVQVTGGELPQEEIQAYIEHGKKSYPGREIQRMEITVDGEYVDINYYLADQPLSASGGSPAIWWGICATGTTPSGRKKPTGSNIPCNHFDWTPGDGSPGFLFPPPSALHFPQLPKVDHGLAGSFGPGLQAGRVAHAAAYINDDPVRLLKHPAFRRAMANGAAPPPDPRDTGCCVPPPAPASPADTPTPPHK